MIFQIHTDLRAIRLHGQGFIGREHSINYLSKVSEPIVSTYRPFHLQIYFYSCITDTFIFDFNDIREFPRRKSIKIYPFASAIDISYGILAVMYMIGELCMI